MKRAELYCSADFQLNIHLFQKQGREEEPLLFEIPPIKKTMLRITPTKSENDAISGVHDYW
jgi:hypothetical protein